MLNISVECLGFQSLFASLLKSENEDNSPLYFMVQRRIVNCLASQLYVWPSYKYRSDLNKRPSGIKAQVNLKKFNKRPYPIKCLPPFGGYLFEFLNIVEFV